MMEEFQIHCNLDSVGHKRFRINGFLGILVANDFPESLSPHSVPAELPQVVIFYFQFSLLNSLPTARGVKHL